MDLAELCFTGQLLPVLKLPIDTGTLQQKVRKLTGWYSQYLTNCCQNSGSGEKCRCIAIQCVINPQFNRWMNR